MKVIALALLPLIVFTGCARNTVETRKKERSAAYEGMPTELRTLVDRGEIQMGMSEDAVYIAWGKPGQVLTSASKAGVITTWLYHNTHLESYRYWTRRGGRYGNHHRSEGYLANDYQLRDYISVEILFEEGKVTEWRTFPYPMD